MSERKLLQMNKACSSCIFSGINDRGVKTCYNPQSRFDSSHQFSLARARDPRSPCGPDGLLHEPRWAWTALDAIVIGGLIAILIWLAFQA